MATTIRYMEEKSSGIKTLRRKGRWLAIGVAILVLLVVLVWGTNLAVNNAYQDKFLPGVKVGGVDIGGLVLTEARSKIDKRIDFINRRGFVYISPDKTVTIYPTVSALASADSVNLIVSWDNDKSLEAVSDWQNNNKFSNLLPKLWTLLRGKSFSIVYNWDREQQLEILQSSFADSLAKKKEASFEFVEDTLIILPEQVGKTFDYQAALVDTKKLIENLSSEDITLKVIEDQPLLTKATVERFRDKIIGISHRGGFYFTYQAEEWFVPPEIWRTWLTLASKDKSFEVEIDQADFANYLEKSGIKEWLEIPVQDARFKLTEGKVTEFISSQPGRKIDIEQSLSDINNTLLTSGELEVALSVEVTEPKVTNDDVNDMGIVEIIGIGESDFSGSPSNRIHNINTGADTLNGMLIAPDEEFSLMTALGEIDGEHGYLQELVIKGDQTIPEYGGGLCQIGTTMFRGALGTGLPVTERRNHSYRVSYYEPAGTDATIYNPWPDLKFKNDTGHYILIQSRIEGTKLYFDFWGTRDGRAVMMTEPTIYNIVAPPEKKIIKTTDLAPGVTKCTERAHSGADAKFDYSVQYPNQPDPIETTFYSHYVPWQEVCLLGVTEEELATEQENQDTATTTPE